MKQMRRLATNYTGIMLAAWLASALFLVHGITLGALIAFPLAGMFTAWTYSAWGIYALAREQVRRG